jgi:hypothetical protein
MKIHFRVCYKQTKTPITLKWIFQIKTFPTKDHSVQIRSIIYPTDSSTIQMYKLYTDNKT